MVITAPNQAQLVTRSILCEASMSETNVFHALGLHMHQPPGNLELLIDANPWEAEQIIRCYERPTRYARHYADVARLHIGFSGILLEQLRDPKIIDRYRHIIDIPAMLAAYRETDNIELIGMGYYHPIFPLIPKADWEDQLRRGREIMQDVFGRAPLGFWPPEMAFSMDMIPALVKAGYEYVVVDGVHVHPEDGVSDIFRPYLACQDGVCISVVPRDRDVSNAQESGLDASWFAHEVTHRCRCSARPHEPRLVTTWSDGENGGWFRQMHEGSGFFGHYLSPYMEHVRGGDYPIRPVSLSAYLQKHAPSATAQVQTGAWNVGSTSGYDFSQWAGSEAQRRAAETVRSLSRRWWTLAGRQSGLSGAAVGQLAEARRLILESETSCYLFWGDDWLPKLYQITESAVGLLDGLETVRDAAAARGTGPAGPEAAASTASGPADPEPEGIAPAMIAARAAPIPEEPGRSPPRAGPVSQSARPGPDPMSELSSEPDTTFAADAASANPASLSGKDRNQSGSRR